MAGLTAIAVTFAFGRYGYGLFLPQIRESFGLSAGAAGVIAAGGYASYFIALVLAGVLTGRTGPRLLILTGTLAAAAGTTLVALAPSTVVLTAGVWIAATSPGWCWAPFSDAVSRQVSRERRDRTLSIITSGTTFGVLVSAAAAWLTGEDASWRLAWFAFAVLCLGSAVWNGLLVVGRPAPARRETDGTGGARDRRWWLERDGNRPLYLAAGGFGLTGTVYWTYAVDRISGGGLPASAAPVFWLVLGAAGILGMATGSLVARLGIRGTLVGAGAALAVASALLVPDPSWVLVAASAAPFGASFMVISALLVIWSADVFPERPAAGFTAALCALAVGAVLGLPVFGFFADARGLAAMFAVNAVATVPILFLRPRVPAGR